MPRFHASALSTYVANLFMAAGAPADSSAAVAASLVDNDRCGHESHGIMRVPRYLNRIEDGTLKPAAVPSIHHRRGANAVIDGGWGFGQVAARAAAALAIEICREHGQAGVGITNAHHIGRLGTYAETLAAAGLVGIVMTGGGLRGGAVAPYGGSRRLFGTNPLAMGVPVPAGQAQLVFDFATSAIAEGKAAVARANATSIPPGCLLDREGRASCDPGDFYAGGALLPFGGHKGYSLMLMIEILATILAGSAPVTSPEYLMGNPTLILAFPVDAFVSRENYDRLVADLITAIHDMPPAEGFARVMVPGEPEHRARLESDRLGIPISEGVWNELLAVGGKSGVTAPTPVDQPADFSRSQRPSAETK